MEPVIDDCDSLQDLAKFKPWLIAPAVNVMVIALGVFMPFEKFDLSLPAAPVQRQDKSISSTLIELVRSPAAQQLLLGQHLSCTINSIPTES